MEYSNRAAANRNGNRKGNALKGTSKVRTWIINAVAYFRELQQELKQYG
jgi:hypothetical protein